MAENRRREALRYLIHERFVAPHHAEAIVANLEAESNFNTRAVGDNGTAHGMGQWRGSRWEALKREYHEDPYDFHNQLDFLWRELSGDEYLRDAWNGNQENRDMFLNASTSTEAAKMLGDNYFRHSSDPQVLQNRYATIDRTLQEIGSSTHTPDAMQQYLTGTDTRQVADSGTRETSYAQHQQTVPQNYEEVIQRHFAPIQTSIAESKTDINRSMEQQDRRFDQSQNQWAELMKQFTDYQERSETRVNPLETIARELIGRPLVAAFSRGEEGQRPGLGIRGLQGLGRGLSGLFGGRPQTGGQTSAMPGFGGLIFQDNQRHNMLMRGMGDSWNQQPQPRSLMPQDLGENPITSAMMNDNMYLQRPPYLG